MRLECRSRILPTLNPGYLLKRKKEAERRQAQISILRACARRALCKARTPSGVPPRFSPKGLSSPKAQRQAMLPGTRPERTILQARPNRGAKDPAPFKRVLPAPNLSQSSESTSRAGHSAGRMMPKPPGSKGDEPKPAGTALAPPAVVRRPASLIRARQGELYLKWGQMSRIDVANEGTSLVCPQCRIKDVRFGHHAVAAHRLSRTPYRPANA